MTDDIDTEIAEMIARRRRRQALGFYYFESNPGSSRQPAGKKQRVTKSRAGQPNWRKRWPPQPARLRQDRTAFELAGDDLESILTAALARLDAMGIHDRRHEEVSMGRCYESAA